MNRQATLLGACHALANATRLLEDAAMLYAAGRAPSSFHLAVMAREELGRFNILGKVANELANGTAVTASDIRKRVAPRSNPHQPKLQAGQSTFILKSPLPDETFLERQQRFTEMRETDSKALHAKRLSAQYVDLNEDETWSTPNDLKDSDALEIIWIVAGEINDTVRWVESDDECKEILERGSILLPKADDLLARTLVLPRSNSDAQPSTPGDAPL
jgi:AbiV family abortive infection protein